MSKNPEPKLYFVIGVRLSRGVFSTTVKITPNGISPCIRERQIWRTAVELKGLDSQQQEDFFDPLQLLVGCNDIDLVESPPVGHGEPGLWGEDVQFHQTDRPRGLQGLVG
jgi:hypothetical protein